MSFSPTALAAQLQKKMGPLYVLHGSAPLLIAEAGDLIRHAARHQGFEDREIIIAGPHFKWDTLRSAAGNLSLFGGGKLIDLRIPNGRPGREGGEALQRFVDSTLNGSGLVALITLPELDWATRKTAWFKALQNTAQILELNTPPRDALPAWIAQRLAQQNQRSSKDSLEFMADQVEGNLLAAHQELQKLALLYPEGELSLDQVKTAVLDVARYNVDDLRQALLEGDLTRSLRLLEGLQGEGVAPPLILWMLANEIRILIHLKKAQQTGAPLTALFKTERIYDDRRRVSLTRALGRMRLAQLIQALRLAARVDRIIKGIAPGQIWDEFTGICVKLARAG